MNKYIFDRLDYYIPSLPLNTEENTFYDEHAMLFNQATREYVDTYLPSLLIKSDIILHSLLNKENIDEKVSQYSYEQLKKDFLIKNILNDLISFKFEDVDIYIPTYDKETNKLIKEDLSSFKKENNRYIKDRNYKVINPFNYYKNKIFESKFCRLIKLNVNNNGDEFFFHSDLNTLFVINSGNIVVEFPVQPDKKNKVDLFNRLSVVAKGYFKLNETDFLDLLLKTHLISSSVYKEVSKDLLKCISK